MERRVVQPPEQLIVANSAAFPFHSKAGSRNITLHFPGYRTWGEEEETEDKEGEETYPQDDAESPRE